MLLPIALLGVDPREPLELFRHPSGELYVPYLVLNLAAAGAVTYRRRRAGESARLVGLDRRSSRDDVAIFVVNAVVFSSVTSALVFGPAAAHWLQAHLARVLGDTAMVHGVAARVVFTIAALLAIDFGYFATHYLQHRLPVLWCFHKVHHSAPVLTPLTAYRIHPVDDLVGALCTTVSVGIIEGVTLVFVDPHVSSLQIAGTNALFVLALALLANLRHSHAWLTVGPFEHLVASPAQHQIHHSNDVVHYDRNFGGILSIWDWMFGTLVVPERRQTLTFGLDTGDAAFPTLASYYFTPVRDSLQVLRHGRQRPSIQAPRHKIAA